MKITLRITQFLNVLAGLSTVGIYWWNINLWRDQAIILTSVTGMALSAVILLWTGTSLLKSEGLKGGTALHGILAVVSFVLQCAVFVLILWQKPV